MSWVEGDAARLPLVLSDLRLPIIVRFGLGLAWLRPRLWWKSKRVTV